MPTYNSLIDRDDSDALAPEDVEPAIFEAMREASVVARLARQLRDGSRKEMRLKVDENLVSAYFVEGDTGLIQTSEATWENKYIEYHKIGVIVPIPEDVDDDAEEDIFSLMIPQIGEAFAAKIDGAVLQGLDVPVSYLWPTNVSAAALAASHSVSLATVVGSGGDLYDALLGVDGHLGKLEADGFDANGHVALLSMKARLRGLRTDDGDPLFQPTPQGVTQYALDGSPVFFPKNGSMSGGPLMISGDWSQLVHSVRRGLTYKVLDQAIITDGAGNVIYNFAQQEMKGLRVTMRWGWQVPNPVNRVNSNAATRYPFARLTA